MRLFGISIKNRYLENCKTPVEDLNLYLATQFCCRNMSFGLRQTGTGVPGSAPKQKEHNLLSISELRFFICKVGKEVSASLNYSDSEVTMHAKILAEYER